jgi:hypothetical protein
LHIDSIAAKLTVKGIRDGLNTLPLDLSGTYDEVVHRINRQSEEEKKLAWLVLSWVTNAQRPLKPSELRVALAIEEKTTKLDPENLLDTETMLSVCAGLVVINEEDNRVRLIHYTIQDYLERIQDREFPHAHTKITTTCITYLLFDTFRTAHCSGYKFCKHLLMANPLLGYAVNYALVHARGQPECDTKELILLFLTQCSGWVELWSYSHMERIPPSGTRVWIAAFFDLREITTCLIPEDGVDSCAVHMAIVRGHTAMARILIGNRTYVEALEEFYDLTLELAMSKENEDTALLLIQPSATNRWWCQALTDLRIAYNRAHRAIVKDNPAHPSWDVMRAAKNEYHSAIRREKRAYWGEYMIAGTSSGSRRLRHTNSPA